MESSKYPQALPVGTALVSPGTAGNPPRRYIIQGVLGAGGFGITYKATTRITFQNLPVDISVAIKEHFVNRDCRRSHDGSVTSTDGYRDEVEASRKAFRTEARRLNEISGRCPYIISVNEVFDANDTTYYVMEFVDGKTLSDYVCHHVENTGRPLSEEEALALFRPLSEAVCFLHDNRVLHQDIKPGNVMLCLNEQGRLYPKLIDFGLSKHYDAQGQPTSTINMAGYSEGYAPLEQYRGIKNFAPTVDVYALGATLYFMLTGTRPRAAGDMLPDDIRTALLAAGVSTVTCEAVVHAMEESRNHRTPDVRTFMQELERTEVGTVQIEDDEPIAPGCSIEELDNINAHNGTADADDKPKEPVKKPAHKKSYAWIGILITALLICAAAGYIAWDQTSHKKPPRKEASEEITIEKEEGRGKVEKRIVKERSKKDVIRPKVNNDSTKTELIQPKKSSVKPSAKSSNSSKNTSKKPDPSSENNKEKKQVTGGGDRELEFH